MKISIIALLITAVSGASTIKTTVAPTDQLLLGSTTKGAPTTASMSLQQASFYKVVNVQDFKSAVSPDIKSPLADPTFTRANEANFCPRIDVIGGYYW